VVSISGKFEELNDNINTILTTILLNQNLCKYIYYNTSSPLSESDITNTANAILFKNLFPYPIIPLSQDSAKTLVTIILDDFSLGRNNSSFKVSKVVFNILCHIDLWKIDGSKLRPLSILSEIDTLFNEQRIVGIGKLNFDSCRWISANDKFQGYSIRYKNYEFN